MKRVRCRSNSKPAVVRVAAMICRRTVRIERGSVAAGLLALACGGMSCASVTADAQPSVARHHTTAARRLARITKPVNEREVFRMVGFAPASTNGRYTFVYGAAGSVPNGDQGGTVINEKTGKANTVAPPPDCGMSWTGPVSGGSSVLFGCSQLEIYTLPNGPWRSLPLNQTVTNQCAAQLSPGGCQLTAVGNAWVEYTDRCYHCGTSYLFENLTTGAVRSSSEALAW